MIRNSGGIAMEVKDINPKIKVFDRIRLMLTFFAKEFEKLYNKGA